MRRHHVSDDNNSFLDHDLLDKSMKTHDLNIDRCPCLTVASAAKTTDDFCSKLLYLDWGRLLIVGCHVTWLPPLISTGKERLVPQLGSRTQYSVLGSTLSFLKRIFISGH